MSNYVKLGRRRRGGRLVYEFPGMRQDSYLSPTACGVDTRCLVKSLSMYMTGFSLGCRRIWLLVGRGHLERDGRYAEAFVVLYAYYAPARARRRGRPRRLTERTNF